MLKNTDRRQLFLPVPLPHCAMLPWPSKANDHAKVKKFDVSPRLHGPFHFSVSTITSHSSGVRYAVKGPKDERSEPALCAPGMGARRGVQVPFEPLLEGIKREQQLHQCRGPVFWVGA